MDFEDDKHAEGWRWVSTNFPNHCSNLVIWGLMKPCGSRHGQCLRWGKAQFRKKCALVLLSGSPASDERGNKEGTNGTRDSHEIVKVAGSSQCKSYVNDGVYDDINHTNP